MNAVKNIEQLQKWFKIFVEKNAGALDAISEVLSYENIDADFIKTEMENEYNIILKANLTLPIVIDFGKYAALTLDEIKNKDYSYFEWLCEKCYESRTIKNIEEYSAFFI